MVDRHGAGEEGGEGGDHGEAGAQNGDEGDAGGGGGGGGCGVLVAEGGLVLYAVSRRSSLSMCGGVSVLRCVVVLLELSPHFNTGESGVSRTVPASCAFSAEPSASYPTIRAISCTSVCASRQPVDAERSCDSLACKHGWVETWAFLGRAMLN